MKVNLVGSVLIYPSPHFTWLQIYKTFLDFQYSFTLSYPYIL